MIKSATPTSIHELFSHEKDINYLIPKYQREYSWTKDQWSALFNDLMEEDALSGHFLGTIIGVDKTEAMLGDHNLEIVDGQQRITTVTLLLLAIFGELTARRECLDNDDQRSDLSNLRRMLVTGSPSRPRVNLQIQNHNSDDFLQVLDEAGTGIHASAVPYAGNRKIKRAFRHFKSCLAERMESADQSEVEVLFDVLNRTKKAIVVTLEVHNHADAFVLFESLNNRGLALTPIDLIKNSLLEKADRTEGLGIDAAYNRWKKWLENLGGEYRDQERFFRQFYNAFKGQWALAVANAPVATRSKLITIFEEMLQGDFAIFADRMDRATSAYGQIICVRPDEETPTSLTRALLDLSRVEGTPSYILMLSLLVNRDEFELSDDDLVEICHLLISFFVRRNLTNTPPTYALDRLFISIVENWELGKDLSPIERIRTPLLAVSSSDTIFLEKLSGPIYDENSSITRFILIQLAQEHMNDEIWTDLWIRDKAGDSKHRYRWTIEHVIPQGENMPTAWIEMLGGEEEAERVLNEDVHKLGNLTITGYNSTLGNLSFGEKKDRKNPKEPTKYVGYRNGLGINAELVEADSWNSADVERRTEDLAKQVLLKFPLG